MTEHLGKFEYVRKRIIEAATEQEELERIVKYGNDTFVLDIDAPVTSGCIHDFGGVIVRRTGPNAGLQSLITSYFGPDDLTRMTTSDAFFIRESDRAWGEVCTLGRLHTFVKNLRSRNYGDVLAFNEFWRLTRQDEGYIEPIRHCFPFISNRTVSISAERRAELEQLYDKDFVVLDLDVPEEAHHTRVEEGVLFWLSNGRENWPEAFVDTLCLTTYEPSRSMYPPNFVVIRDGNYGPITSSHSSRSVYTMNHSYLGRIQAIEDFNRFWKLKSGDDGFI